MAYHRASLAHRSSKHGPLRCAPRVCQKKSQWVEAPYIGGFRPGSSQKHGTSWPVGPTKDINPVRNPTLKITTVNVNVGSLNWILNNVVKRTL